MACNIAENLQHTTDENAAELQRISELEVFWTTKFVNIYSSIYCKVYSIGACHHTLNIR